MLNSLKTRWWEHRIGSGMDEGRSRTSGRRSPITYAPPVLILVGIVVWSIAPFPIPDLPGPLGGVPHAVAYAALMWTALNVPRVFSDANDRPHWSRIFVLTLLAAAVGAGVELGQAVVHRDAEIADFIADVVGITAAVLVWLASRKRLGRSTGR